MTKKTMKTKPRLVLATEKLRDLTAQDLEGAAGGTSTGFTTFWTTSGVDTLVPSAMCPPVTTRC